VKLTQLATSPYQSVLLYGPPKTGKTQLAGELSKEFNLIWFDLENGYATLRKLPQEQQEKIELISIPDNRSWPIAIETCLKVIKSGTFKICDTHGKIGCALCTKNSNSFTEVIIPPIDSQNTIVVFDSLTQLTNSAVAHITKDKPDDYRMEFVDWGNLGKLMDVFLSHVQTARFHVLCISHETEAEQEDGKVKIVPTAGTRNFSRNAAKYFGHVIYSQVSNMKHRFTSSTTATVNIMVGSRSDFAIEKMGDNVSLSDIFKGKVASQLGPTQGQVASSSLMDLLKKK